MPGCDIVPISESHAVGLARLHQRCFPDYFLTRMGQTFLARYYREYARHDFDYGVVALRRDDALIVGFAVGTSDSQAHFRAFYRSSMLVLLPIAVWRFLTDRVIRRSIWRRMSHMKAAARSLIPGMKRPSSETLSDKGPRQQCPLRLLSIAVDPDQRGSGLAAGISARFEEMLRQDGHTRVGLSVLPNNLRAIAFYKKVGWKVTHESDAGIWFEKDL